MNTAEVNTVARDAHLSSIPAYCGGDFGETVALGKGESIIQRMQRRSANRDLPAHLRKAVVGGAVNLVALTERPLTRYTPPSAVRTVEPSSEVIEAPQQTVEAPREPAQQKMRERPVGSERRSRNNPMVPCACGCGKLRLQFMSNGQEARFIAGHAAVQIVSDAQRERVTQLRQEGFWPRSGGTKEARLLASEGRELIIGEMAALGEPLTWEQIVNLDRRVREKSSHIAS